MTINAAALVALTGRVGHVVDAHLVICAVAAQRRSLDALPVVDVDGVLRPALAPSRSVVAENVVKNTAAGLLARIADVESHTRSAMSCSNSFILGCARRRMFSPTPRRA